MAETLELSDGTVIICVEPPEKFLADLILAKLGSEAANMFERCIQALKRERDRHEAVSLSCEKEADGYRNLCIDAMNALQELQALLTDPRLNRQKVQKHIDMAYNDLYKNL